MKKFVTLSILAVLGACGWGAAVQAAPGTAALYQQHCSECHGAGRLGAMGPALLPENLGRVKRDEAVEIVVHGRIATQMPAFGDRLSAGAKNRSVEPTGASWPIRICPMRRFTRLTR